MKFPGIPLRDRGLQFKLTMVMLILFACSLGSVYVTVATVSGTATERYAATAVRAQETRAARIASEVAQASRGAAGTIPLAAAPRVPAYGG